MSQPVIFLSHGAGPSFFMDAKDMPVFGGLDKHSKAADYLRNFVITNKMMRPKCILVMSAHWQEAACSIQISPQHNLYYDYGGFPPDMYKLQWPAPGDPVVAQKVKNILQENRIPCSEDNKRGLDHGVFVPLKLVFPEADIPVLEVSLLRNGDIADHLKIAEALAPLRKENILIVGSGFATHKMGDRKKGPADWAKQFKSWLNNVLTNPQYSKSERKNQLLQYQSAPFFKMAHPTNEHFFPLAMCSAASEYSPGTLLYSEFIGESLLNEHYMF